MSPDPLPATFPHHGRNLPTSSLLSALGCTHHHRLPVTAGTMLPPSATYKALSMAADLSASHWIRRLLTAMLLRRASAPKRDADNGLLPLVPPPSPEHGASMVASSIPPSHPRR